MVKTHALVDAELCGEPVELSDGYARVKLKLTDRMKVDASGLVHGGFVFGAADLAAMLAVNHPNVVLAAADVRFLKPCSVGETVEAVAKVEREDGKKRTVAVEVRRDGEKVFEGSMLCIVPERHVLADRR